MPGSVIPTLQKPSAAAAAAAAAKSLQSCPTLCDPMDSSPPGSPVPGLLQARTLEWGAISALKSGIASMCKKTAERDMVLRMV